METSDIRLKASDGREFAAYYVCGNEPSAPGVVLAQEIFGINSFVRDAAQRVAAAGFDVIAPDLFWRQEPGLQLSPDREADREKAMNLMKGLDQAEAVEDLSNAAAFLRAQRPDRRVGIVGYCLGGKFAFLLAARGLVDAAVSYYGVAIQNALSEAANFDVPLLLHIAEEDHLCPAEARDQIVDALQPRGAEVMIYPGAGHGFARTRSPAYVAEAASRANAATDAFLARHLA